MNETPIRVMIVDDHAMVLDALRSALTARPEVEVAATASSLRDARELIAVSSIDVILTDYTLGDGHGTELASDAARRSPPASVLIFSGTVDQWAVDEALDAGCAGFVSKSEGIDQLVAAIGAAARGAAVFPASMLAASRSGTSDVVVDLTQREQEVLQLLADAMSVPEIADELHLSVHTVRNHVKQILSKLGVRSQLQAVVVAARRGVVRINPS